MFAHTVIVGRVLLDLFFKEPLHDTYSIIVGIHALTVLSMTYRFIKRRVQVFDRYQRGLSTYALGAHPAREVISVLSKKVFRGTILAINGGIILPFLVGFAAYFYIFITLDIIFGGGVIIGRKASRNGAIDTSSLMQISVLMVWCYGVVIINLVYQVATGVMKENRLSRFADEVSRNFLGRLLVLGV